MLWTGWSSIFSKPRSRFYIYLFLQFILVENSKCGKELNLSAPQTAATTFAFSSVFILLLRRIPMVGGWRTFPSQWFLHWSHLPSPKGTVTVNPPRLLPPGGRDQGGRGRDRPPNWGQALPGSEGADSDSTRPPLHHRVKESDLPDLDSGCLWRNFGDVLYDTVQSRMTSQSDVLFTVDNIVYFHVAQQCLIERLLKQKCANMTLTVTHRRRIE